MSYVIMKIYSFTCDRCGQTEDTLPIHGGGLRGAEKDLRAAGWRVLTGDWRRHVGRMKHLCPKCDRSGDDKEASDE